MKRKFMECGIAGWCLEIIWTAIQNRNKDKKWMGTTSLLMFPIYGVAAFFEPFMKKIKDKNFIIRGGIYTFFIYLVEFLSGKTLKKQGKCPWDYSHAKYNLDGVIRLDYAPVWFVTGLILEKIVAPKEKTKKTTTL